jgi:hypothetical protein
MTMMINENAPVVAKAEIEVVADPEIIWEVLTDISHWPSWNPEVKWASLDGELAVGTEFRWKAGPGTIRSTIQRIEHLRFLAWTGKTLGINAIHVWQLDSLEGKTIVRTEESWEGLIVRIFRRSLQKMLEKTTDDGLRHLKAEAERRSIH